MARQPAHSSRNDDQLLLPFPSLAGRSFTLTMHVDYPASTDPDTIRRLDLAGRRLRRGAIAGKSKLRQLARCLETAAGLFDGA